MASTQSRPNAYMTDPYPNASMIRRLAAILYDTFLVVAVWMISTTLLIALVSNGDAMDGWPYQLFLYVEMLAFYYVFWRIKGQTLGMQVWKIRAVTDASGGMDATHCLSRFLLATLTLVPLGLGLLWMLIDRDRLALYDRWSKTRIIYLGDKPYDSEK
jgi:uncharacterized RDD family membrane protein YckC